MLFFIEFFIKKYFRNSPKSLDTLHVTPRTPYNKDHEFDHCENEAFICA